MEYRSCGKSAVRAVVLCAAALMVGCQPPGGIDDRQVKGAAADVQTLDVSPGTLQVQETANPTQLFIKGSGLGVEATTITLAVTGYGGTTLTAVPMDIILAIDSSASMGIPNRPGSGSDPSGLRMTAAKSFVDKLNPARDRAAVVSWDDGIDFTYPPTGPYPNPAAYSVLSSPPNPPLTTTLTLTSDYAALKTQIDTVNAEGNTNLVMGLSQSIRMLDASPRTGAVAAIIFLTDGQDTSGWPQAQDILNSWVSYAKTRGYRIYSIGLGSSVAVAPLQNMAAQTGGHYYSAPTADNLQALYDQIYSEVLSSTAPSAVNLVEVTPSYIVDQGGFSVTPDSVVTDAGTGETTLTWLDVARHVGNNDSHLASDEIFQVSFSASSSRVGVDLPVNTAAAAVTCLDPGGAAQSLSLPKTLITVSGKIAVKIDIEPWCDRNSINIREDEVIPVAILSSDTFDALTVDPTTVTFAGAHEARFNFDHRADHVWRCKRDVNRDGKPDLVLYFRLDETSLTRASTVGVVNGMTFGGIAIEGQDVVHMLVRGWWEDRCGDRFGRWEGYGSRHDHGRDHDDPDCRSDWHFR